MIMILSGSVVNTFMITREEIVYMEQFALLHQATKEHYDLQTDPIYLNITKVHQDNRKYTLSSSIVVLLLIIYFGTIELRQCRDAGFSYFVDTWNLIDMTSLCLNFTFVTMFFVCVVYDRIFFQRELILSIASWAMLFMWLKVFYWFRLFPSYAYYVRLIM